MEEEQQQPIKLEELGSLEILQIVKNSQSQNGLKHGDYGRYRNYCTKKIRKMRKSMKFIQSKKEGKSNKYEKKEIMDVCPNDPKILQVFLFQAEKEWAFAMDLRQVMSERPDDTGNRMRFHVIKKLNRSFQYAKILHTMCSKRSDKNTTREAFAYSQFIGGFLHHEKKQWDKALLHYIKSRQVYDELIQISDSLKNAIFKEKIEQLDQSIRYSYQQNGGSVLDSIATILSKHKGDHIEIEQTNQQKGESGLVEIQFQNHKYPIKNQKVIELYQNIQAMLPNLQDLKEKNNNQETQEKLLNCYIELFSNYDDAIKYVTKDKEKQTNSEAEKEIYNGMLDYFQSQKYNYLIERNALHIKDAVKKFEDEQGLNNLPELMTKRAYKLKLTRPQEIVKLCDNYLQVMKQLTEIERKNQDLTVFRQLDGQEIMYKSIRCFFVSTIYYANGKNIETLSLLEQADTYLHYSQQKLSEIGFTQEDQQLKYFIDLLNYFKIRVKVQALENSNFQEENLTKNIKNLNISGSNANLTIADLIKLDNIEVDIADLSNRNIVDVPPKPSISGCKPIFIDLAYQNLQYPDISSKVKEEKKGIFSKFNLFGKK